ncbi:DUF3365 domain-containing protein [Alcanivorax sp.]|uniref:Tll0287-like domain-containing protein n=1 Tax=Alcanivorax sp. TaxID=1872427 RepID=UPI002B27AA8C|nr:DUF3365 domain-containing protein [Alcanivorax sp.]
MHLPKKTLAAILIGTTIIAGCSNEEHKTVPMKQYTDSIYHVINADRANYTKIIIKRLGQEGEKAIKPSEQWRDHANGAPLPAQMFRLGAEEVSKATSLFSYSLQSLWPINSQNSPKTELEEKGLTFIEENPGSNFYGEEKLGDSTYFTAIYPDIAVAKPCIACHNNHSDSPRSDFKIGEVMGGVVIRVPTN